MTKQYKYYSTNVTIYDIDKIKKLKELGYQGYHSQFQIICKAKSMAEANRIAESFGFENKCFRKDYTSETGNDIQIEMADKYNFIIRLNGTMGDTYINIKEIM